MYSKVRNRKRTRFVWCSTVAMWTSRHLNGSFSDKNKATSLQRVCIHFHAGSPRSCRRSESRSHKAREKRIERGFTSDCGSEENRRVPHSDGNGFSWAIEGSHKGDLLVPGHRGDGLMQLPKRLPLPVR